MKIIICTIKSWNIALAEKFKKDSPHEVYIITQKDRLNVEYVQEIRPDYIFFPHWSYYIPEEIYSRFNCIVFHMTDLPFGRGGSPLQNLIVRGYEETVISAIRVVKEVDAGPVFCKKPLPLYGSASEIFYRASRIIFDQIIPEIIEKDMKPIPQEGEAVFFKRRTAEQSEIFADMTLEQIYDHIRMLDAEGYPNAYIRLGKYKILFSRAQQGCGSVTCYAEIKEETENE